MTIPVRHPAIPGWDQRVIHDTRVGVAGANLSAVLLIKALLMIGVMQVTWVGGPTPRASAVSSALLPGDPAVLAYPFDVTSGAELGLALGDGLHALLVTSADSRLQHAAAQVARSRGIPALFASTIRDRGWFGTSAPPAASCGQAGDDPVLALTAAALLLEGVRELRCPRRGLPPDGELLPAPPTPVPAPAPAQRITVIGCGGIGTWLALVLALSPGPRTITLVDHDRVEPHNLANQLFTPASVGAYKVEAARRLLQPLAADGVRFLAEAQHFHARLATHVDAVASCVDNAQTRLLLQQSTQCVPLISGSIDVHAADCHVQNPRGPTLDRQLRGQLTRRAATPAAPRPRTGGCTGAAYIVPGMIAASMVADRILHPAATATPPMHWRAGRRPTEGPPA